MVNYGCVLVYDFVWGVLILGFEEKECIGVNLFEFGFIGLIDIYLFNLGDVCEVIWSGYLGYEICLEIWLGLGFMLSNWFVNFGGFVGVWVEENFRDSIFDVMKWREVFLMLGFCICLWFFVVKEFDENMCIDVDWFEKVYVMGVLMGFSLGVVEFGGWISFFVFVLCDLVDFVVFL